MDATGIVALVLTFVLAFMVSGLRRRLVRLENVVLRLQDRVAELGSRLSTPETSTAIDIEPFVD